MNNMNNNNFNRNFSGGQGMGNMGGGFNPGMGGFQGNPMGGQFGGGFNRGGMMGNNMRGGPGGMRGRGGMTNNMMGGMPMGGMAMGGMAGGMGGMPMNMGPMGGGMPGRKSSRLPDPYFGGVLLMTANALAGISPSDVSAGTLPKSPAEYTRAQLAPISQGPVPYSSPSVQPPLKTFTPQVFPLSQEQLAKNPFNKTGTGGFQGMQPHFNPAFFPQNQAGGGDWQNPHGAKRPRPE
jgi:hypothetical protein